MSRLTCALSGVTYVLDSDTPRLTTVLDSDTSRLTTLPPRLPRSRLPSSTGAAVARAVDQALQPTRHSGQVHPGALGQPCTVESVPSRPAGRPRPGRCCREQSFELNSQRMFVLDQLVDRRTIPPGGFGQA